MAYLDIINPEHPAAYVTKEAGKIIPRGDRPVSDVPLANKQMIFLDYLKKHYAHSTFLNYRWLVNMAINAGKRGFFTYNQLLAKYNQRNVKCYLIQIMLFDLYDLMPSAGRLDFSLYYYSLSNKNRSLLENILFALKAKKIKPSTINIEASFVAKFLNFGEECGMTDIHEIDESIIRDYAAQGRGTNEVLHRIGVTLKYFAKIHSDTVLLRIAGLFPRLHKGKKIYKPLLETEREKIEDYLTNPTSNICKRDRAICLLIFYTGLRSVDVRLMVPGNIDLANQQIHLVQKKTGVHLRVPMIPIVSNAIVDYVQNERPKNGYPYLFVPDRISQKPMNYHRPYTCDVKRIVNNIYDTVGIRLNGERRGTHILRHAVGDKMLNTGTDISVISRILGHTNPTTTFNYITVNIDQLRACALPIDDYPIKSKLYEKNAK